jgi:hypothetical protein
MSKRFALFLFCLTPLNTFASELPSPKSSLQQRLSPRPSPIKVPRCVSQSTDDKRKSVSPLSLSPEHKSPAQLASPKNIPVAPPLPQNSAPHHRKQSSKTVSL